MKQRIPTVEEFVNERREKSPEEIISYYAIVISRLKKNDIDEIESQLYFLSEDLKKIWNIE